MNESLLVVDSTDVDYVWDDVQPLIDKALIHSEGELLSEDIFKLIKKEMQVLWVGIKDKELFCAGVTEIIKYPRKKVL